MPPEEFVKLIAFIKENRQSGEPFDVIHGGRSKADNAPETIRPYADAGVTWWLESIDPWSFGGDTEASTWPLDAMRARITAGPPKL